MTLRATPGLALATVLAAAAVTTAAQNSSEPVRAIPLNVPFLSPVDEWPSESRMHATFVDRFRAAVGLGRARMITGNMRIHDRMTLKTWMPRDEGASEGVTVRYRLNSLELIGIARHPKPVAVAIEKHGDGFASASQRQLSTFEQRAIARLRAAGSDVVAQTDGPTRLVVGAVRAEAGCTRCHAGFNVGELLGAFSYRLQVEGRIGIEGATDPGNQP
jgi:hypothetical protein